MKNRINLSVVEGTNFNIDFIAVDRRDTSQVILFKLERQEDGTYKVQANYFFDERDFDTSEKFIIVDDPQDLQYVEVKVGYKTSEMTLYYTKNKLFKKETFRLPVRFVRFVINPHWFSFVNKDYYNITIDTLYKLATTLQDTVPNNTDGVLFIIKKLSNAFDNLIVKDGRIYKLDENLKQRVLKGGIKITVYEALRIQELMEGGTK